MKRHDVYGILPFIAAGVLGGSALADISGLSGAELTTDPNFSKKTTEGSIAGVGCCGTCEYALDDGTSETTVGAGVPIVWYNYLEVDVCTEICAISVAFGATGFPDGSPIKVLVYEDPTDDNDPSDAILLASVDDFAANVGTDILNCYDIGPVSVTGGFFAAVVALDLGADTFPAAIDQTATQGQSWAGFGFTDPADPLADGTQGIIDGFGIPGNWLLRASAAESGLSGACCVSQDCSITTAGECFDLGGVYLGDGSACEAGVCGGACCFDDGTCEILSDDACVTAGGSFQGNGTDCDSANCPQIQPNDDCANAITIAIGGVVTGDTTLATLDDAPFCGVSVDSPGVWYTVVGNGNELTASLCETTTYDAKIHVYCGSCEDLGCVGGDDDGCGVGGGPSTLTFCSAAGETYYILVEGWEGSTGAFDLQVTSGAACDNPICGSGNFACETAAAINAGDVVNDNTCDGAVAVGAPICPGGQTNLAGKWYVYTGDGNTATVSTCGTAIATFDLDVDIYCAGPEGNECAALECTEATFSPCNVFFQDFDFCTVAGNTYYIHVYGVQPGGFDECGDYQVAVSSDGEPCEDFTACDAPGCADPTAGSNVLAQAVLAGPSVLGVTQDPNTGTIYALQLFDRTWEELTWDGTNYTSNGVVTFDPGFTAIPETLGPPFASGLTYDSVNDTLWIMVAQDNAGAGWTMFEVSIGKDVDTCPEDTNDDGTVDVQDLTNVILDWGSDGSGNGGDVTGDGTVDVSDLTAVILAWGECPLGGGGAAGIPTGNTISDPAFAGLAADVEHDAATDTFWYVDIVADEIHNVNRAGTELAVVPQSCIAVENPDGVFGNGCDVSNGVLEVLVGSLVSETGTADRAVPISPVDGSTLGDCSFGCSSVTSIVTESTFTSSICRDRMTGDVMHVVASGGDLIIAIEAAPLPAP